MGKVSTVEISGHQYRYEYVDGKTLYRGPVGDAPSMSEEEFLRLLDDISIKPNITINKDETYGDVNRDWRWEMKWTPYGKKKDNGRIMVSAYKREVPPTGMSKQGMTSFGLQIAQTTTPRGHDSPTININELTDEQRLQLTMAVDQASKWLVQQLLIPEEY